MFSDNETVDILQENQGYSPLIAELDEVRAFLDEKLPKEIASKVKNNQHLGKEDTIRWQKILNEQGWLALHWPKEYGGTGWSPIQKHLMLVGPGEVSWGCFMSALGANQARVKPIYETLPGWKESTEGARSWADLPAQAVKYVRHVEELIGAPVALLSTSPERDDTILVQNPFQD